MALTGAHIRSALAAVGAVGGQITTYDNLAAGANAALARAPKGLTKEGAAAFLATQAQESAFFRTTQEYGAGKNRYSPYDGRTFDQLTWSGNYAGFGKWCVTQGYLTDANYFVKNPTRLADYRWAWLGGIWFFDKNNLWKYGNRGDFLAVSQGVNGGNGTIGTKFVPGGYKTRYAMYKAFLALGDKLLPGPADYSTDIAHWFSDSDAKTLQKWVGVTADGVIGLDTIKALQRKAGVTADGIVGTATIKALQKIAGVTQDGKMGKVTAAALLSKAKGSTASPSKPTTTGKLTVDGLFGDACRAKLREVTKTGDNFKALKALQKALNDKGAKGYDGKKLAVDGVADVNNTVHDTKKQNTNYAWQVALGMPVKDGVFSHNDGKGSDAVRKIQSALNNGKLF